MTPKRVRTVEGSCWACKDRRVICDLQRPQCKRCLAEDQACEYGKLRLRWCNGVAARGRFAGQNVPIQSNPQQQELQRGSFSTLLDSQACSPSLATEKEGEREQKQGHDQDQDQDQDQEQEQEQYEKDQFQQQSLPLLSSSSSSSSSSKSTALLYRHAFNVLGVSSLVTAEQLMLYFEYVVVDRFSLSTQPVLVDLASIYKYPVLRYSATAVANAHQQLSLCSSRRHDSFICRRSARLKAIQNVRTQLQNPCQQVLVSRQFLPLDLFIANVLLCILDGVIDPHDEGAAAYVHYRGGRAILSQWKLQQQLQRRKRGLPALMLSCFATMDLTFSLLSGEDQYFQHTTWTHFAGSDGWWGLLPHGDPFLDIMCIFSRLARLGHLARYGNGGRETTPESFAVDEELDTLLMALRGYASTPADGTDQLPLIQKESFFNDCISGREPLAAHLLSPMYSTCSSFDYNQSWIVYCNAYRLAGLIYVYRVFYHLDVTHQLVQQATNLGVRAVCDPRLTGKLAHCLLFPALVIGAHCRVKIHQKAILKAMQTTASFLQFGSLRVMENFLQGVWARHSSKTTTTTWSSNSSSTLDSDSESEQESETWWECFEPISKKSFLF